MDDDKRWTIKAFDFKHANKKETPPLNEAVGGYENLRYSQWEQDALKREGFHWVPSDKEWYNDSRGEGTMSVYKDSYDNHYVLRRQVFIDDYDAEDDYEHYKSLQDLINDL